MLTVRIQVIDGTGTFTLSDSQPCRLLTSLHRRYPASRGTTNLSAAPGRPACPSRASGWSSLDHALGSPVLRTLSLCTCCRQYPGTAIGRTTSLNSPKSCQPSPIWQSGRPAHRPFRGLLGVHSRYGLHTRAVTVYRDTLSEGFSHFSIPHAELVKSVTRRIVDRRVLHLIKMWLDCPVEETDDRGRKTRTTEA